MQNILSKYSILYLTNHTNWSAHKDYFSNPKGVTWEAVLNVQDWPTVPPPPCRKKSQYILDFSAKGILDWARKVPKKLRVKSTGFAKNHCKNTAVQIILQCRSAAQWFTVLV